MSTTILAGDLGGTKTLLGLFEADASRPRRVAVRSFPTIEFTDLPSMIAAFAVDPPVRGRHVDSACFGVAGPVLGRTATLTNVPLTIDADAVGRAFDIPHVSLVNDLVAMAWSLRALNGDEVVVLQEGQVHPQGNLALVAAGTGFNEAMVLHAGGRFVPTASESGHADWAARNDREIRLLRDLVERFGRAEIESVLSGPGIVNIHKVTHQAGCLAVDDVDAPEAAARISRGALERSCQGCIDALQLFVAAYGAEAGNLALRGMATGGLFVGGGIAPKILPLLTDGRFMRSFLDKGTFRVLLGQVPVRVIVNPEAALLGAAIAATLSAEP